MDMLDDELQKLIASAGLEETTCGLKHSKADPSENHPAVDYLCQDFGHDLDGHTMTDATIQIPICQECVIALVGNTWVLCYCMECMSSQWILKSRSKLKYRSDVHVLWMKECPICYSENVKQLEES